MLVLLTLQHASAHLYNCMCHSFFLVPTLSYPLVPWWPTNLNTCPGLSTRRLLPSLSRHFSLVPSRSSSNLLVHVAEVEDTRGILGSFHLLHNCVVGPCSGLLFTLSHQPKVQTPTEPRRICYAGPLHGHVCSLCGSLGNVHISRWILGDRFLCQKWH